MINEEDLSATSHIEFIKDIISIHRKSFNFILFIVGDNRNLMKAIANLLDVPLIGCASHRFNLAVEEYLNENFENEITKIKNIMMELNRFKERAKSRKSTNLSPIIFNDTRWSGKVGMIKRYIEIKQFISETNLQMVNLMPNPIENFRISDLSRIMEKFQSVTTTLQGKISLYDVRILFDTIIIEFPTTSKNLSPTASIIHSKDLENGIIKIIKGSEFLLIETEKGLLASYPLN